MKTIDYINILIKEKENLTDMCKSHAETIRFMKREIGKLNNIILKKDKKIQKLENEKLLIDVNKQKELDNIKQELENLKINYKNLKIAYDNVVEKNDEYLNIFNEIEKSCDDSE